MNILKCTALKGTPAIDGYIDPVWNTVDVNTAVHSLVDGVSGPDSVEFRVLWDDVNLYVLAEVSDPIISDRGTWQYEADSIEFFVGEAELARNAYNGDNHSQIRVDINNRVSGINVDQVTSAVRETVGGYRVEAAFPFRVLTKDGATPAVGAELGFMFQCNENKGLPAKACTVVWTEMKDMPDIMNAFRDPRVFGRLILAESNGPGEAGEPEEEPQDQGIKVKIDDEEALFAAPPQQNGSEFLFPYRELLNKLGASAVWESASGTISAYIRQKDPADETKTIEKLIMQMKIGDTKAIIDRAEYDLETPPGIIANRVYIPLSFVCQGLKATFAWNEETKTVRIEFSDKDEGDSPYTRPNAEVIIADLKANSPDNKHPRIMANQEDFDRIKQLAVTDNRMMKWKGDVIKSADDLLDEPVLQQKLDNRNTMLGISKAAKERTEALSMAWKLTDDSRYAQRAWDELEAVISFPHWNLWHFLDVGEMTAAAAIGYDWLYDFLSPEQKAVIRDAIIQKAFKPALDIYRGVNLAWWVTSPYNWNAVCNGGLAMGALAIGDEGAVEEAMAGEILSSGLRSLEYLIPTFAPDGGWEEGVAYWGYMMEYLSRYLGSLDTALGKDYGYFNVIPGIEKTGYFPPAMSSSLGSFNFHDARFNPGETFPTEMLWLANKNNDAGIAGLRLRTLDNGGAANVRDMVYYNPQLAGKSPDLPLDIYVKKVETTSFRSQWNDRNSTFVALHGGNNNISHSHLDTGTFVLDMLGERWAMELGPDNYASEGFGNAIEGGKRWNNYFMRPEGQNTIVLQPSLKAGQLVVSTSPVVKLKSGEKTGFALLDMTPAYAEYVEAAMRGVMLTGNRSVVVVQDEIKAKVPSEFWWFMHTEADIELAQDGRSAILTQNGKRVWAGLRSSADASFEVMDAVRLPSSPPTPAGQNSTTGIRKLAIRLKDIEDLKISVVFIPLQDSEQAPANVPKVKDLADWVIEEDSIGGVE